MPLTVVNNFAAPYNDIAIQGPPATKPSPATPATTCCSAEGGGDLLKGGAGDDAFRSGGDVTGSGTRNIELGDGTLRAVSIAGLAGTSDIVQGGIGTDRIVLEKGAAAGYVSTTPIPRLGS